MDVSGIARLRGDRHLGILLDVIGDQVGEIHPVQVIACEDEDVVGLHRVEVAPCLAHGVRCALEPRRAVGGLLRREDVDEPRREVIQPVALRHVTIERGGIELRQDEDLPQVRMQAVADRYVDEAILAADRDGRFGTRPREREEAVPPATTQDEGQHRMHGAHTLVGLPEDGKPTFGQLRQRGDLQVRA